MNKNKKNMNNCKTKKFLSKQNFIKKIIFFEKKSIKNSLKKTIKRETNPKENILTKKIR